MQKKNKLFNYYSLYIDQLGNCINVLSLNYGGSCIFFDFLKFLYDCNLFVC